MVELKLFHISITKIGWKLALLPSVSRNSLKSNATIAIPQVFRISYVNYGSWKSQMTRHYSQFQQTETDFFPLRLGANLITWFHHLVAEQLKTSSNFDGSFSCFYYQFFAGFHSFLLHWIFSLSSMRNVCSTLEQLENIKKVEKKRWMLRIRAILRMKFQLIVNGK